jgi:RNA 2',3'-cyclic 3'-phosphodiesterase
MAQELVRAFLAIELSHELKNEIEQLVGRARNLCQGFRFIVHDSWHLTLHFFGSVEVNLIERVKPALNEALTDVSPFSISLEEVGVFPGNKRPSVLWVGVGQGRAELIALKRAVDSVLGKLKYQVETRPFHPHVTVARVKRGGPAPTVSADLTFRSEKDDLIKEIILFRSDLLPRGAKYTALFRVPLGRSS